MHGKLKLSHDGTWVLVLRKYQSENHRLKVDIEVEIPKSKRLTKSRLPQIDYAMLLTGEKVDPDHLIVSFMNNGAGFIRPWNSLMKIMPQVYKQKIIVNGDEVKLHGLRIYVNDFSVTPP